MVSVFVNVFLYYIMFMSNSVEYLNISSTGDSTDVDGGWYEQQIFGMYKYHSFDRRGNNIFYANIGGTDKFVQYIGSNWVVSI